jgi:hypothetical protein
MIVNKATIVRFTHEEALTALARQFINDETVIVDSTRQIVILKAGVTISIGYVQNHADPSCDVFQFVLRDGFEHLIKGFEYLVKE